MSQQEIWEIWIRGIAFFCTTGTALAIAAWIATDWIYSRYYWSQVRKLRRLHREARVLKKGIARMREQLKNQNALMPLMPSAEEVAKAFRELGESLQTPDERTK